MHLKQVSFLLLAVLVLVSGDARARLTTNRDESITFEDFVNKVGIAFSDELLSDLRTKLPEEFRIWGYDIGDFSGDGKYDIVLSIKPKNYRGKNVQVRFFVNKGDTVLDLRTMDVGYCEIPIEVGFTIEKCVCFMTSKLAEYNWLIRGYTFWKGAFMLVDQYETKRLTSNEGKHVHLGLETYSNYRNLLSNENLFNPNSNKSYEKIDFYTLPAYRKGGAVFRDFSTTIFDSTDDLILVGRDNWRGASDLSFAVNANYDSTNLTVEFHVRDQSLVSFASDAERCDYVQLWFTNRCARSEELVDSIRISSSKSDSSVYCLTIFPGNLTSIRASADLICSCRLSAGQLIAISRMEISAKRNSDGYSLDIQIPLRLFSGTDSFPRSLMGFTAAVHDVDDSLTSGDSKLMATSRLVKWNSSTFGLLRFIREGECYGEAENFVMPSVLKRIEETGL
jgi:hypothetical protein